MIQPYTYTGREYDPETGLYYYRARYYDARIGRFLQEDPFPGFLTSPQSLNPYPYVENNPVTYEDPFGLQMHGGFIKAVVKMANKSLVKTIKSLKKIIEKHSKPLDPRDAKKYAHEKRVAEDQLKIAEEEARRRGLLGGGLIGACTAEVGLDEIIEKIGEVIIDILFDPVPAY